MEDKYYLTSLYVLFGPSGSICICRMCLKLGNQCSLVEFKDSGLRGVPSAAELMFPDVFEGNNAATEGISNEN